jgi:hypothetical protein
VEFGTVIFSNDAQEIIHVVAFLFGQRERARKVGTRVNEPEGGARGVSHRFVCGDV